MPQLDLGLGHIVKTASTAPRSRFERGILARMMMVAPTLSARPSELQIARAAVGLGALNCGGPLSESEHSLVTAAAGERSPSADELAELEARIRAGEDPLGDLFSVARSAQARRTEGAFYTPPSIVQPMVAWVLSQEPSRLVDAGCGSGRFAAAVARKSPELPIVAVDLDPLATLMTRGTLAVIAANSVRVVHGDYTTLAIEHTRGRTAWIGNPPYVRHHELTQAQKGWAASLGEQLGHRPSGLSGLHAHFFLATAARAAVGDVGCFVTSAEWLDVSWGSIIRHLLLNGLGGLSLDMLEPRAIPFEDAMTTAVMVAFEVGAHPSGLRLRLIEKLVDGISIGGGRLVERETLIDYARWTPLLRGAVRPAREGLVPLGSIARVHRGVATGANGFFIMSRAGANGLGLQEWARPVVTRASEIIEAEGVVRDDSKRCVIIDAPARFDWRAHPSLVSYLRRGKRVGANGSYLAIHRQPWWRLGITAPPPIIATYMARRPPTFALNPDGLVLTNVAHGIYPIQPLAEEKLEALVERLNSRSHAFVGNGRTYHGGLEKFEPREMESLLVEWDP